jgi:protein SCO1/2
MKRLLLAVLLGLSAAPLAIAAAPLPPESVLQQAGAYTDQAGRNFHLADRRGHVQIVSMFYASCTYTCPLMIDSGLGVEHALKPAQRAALRLLLVTFDPQRDTPAALDALAVKRHLDTSRWTLARADEDSVRKLAAMLGIRYRKLANGDFNHTTGLILLDADGRILARTDHLGAVPDPAFLAAVQAALDKPGQGAAR